MSAAASHGHPGHHGRRLPHTQAHVPNPEAALNDARSLNKALKGGWFTNDEGVFNILCKRTSAQIQDIRAAYEQEFKGASLLEDVKKETHMHLEDLLKALVYTPAEYDAYRIFRACDGLTTNEEALIEILSHREPFEVRAFNEAFQRMYGSTAHAKIEKATSGEIGLLFSGLADPRNERNTPANEAQQIQDDVKSMYDGSQNKTIGHDAVPFVRVLSQNNYAYVRKVYAAYVNAHGKTLENIIGGWTIGGHLAKALIAVVTPPEEYYSTLCYKAMKGITTDQNTLIRVIVEQRERYLPQVAEHFVHEYKKALKEFVNDETSGDFKHALVALLEFYAEIKA